MKETKSKQAKAETESKSQGLKNITKSSVWDIQENDVFRLINSGLKDSEVKENLRHYIDIFRAAFMIEEVKGEGAHVKKAYEKQGYKVGNIALDDDTKVLWAVRKRPIMRVTDLTYENIRHISASKLIEVLDRNFGGGWDSLSQSIQDIIESGFDISTTTLPKDRLHKKGGMYEKKVEDGFEVLEVEKGGWVEAIFAKLKPEQEKLKMHYTDKSRDDEEGDDEDDEDFEVEDNYSSHDEEDNEVEDPNDEDITEDNYSTMMDLGSEDPEDEAANLIEFADE